LEEPKSFENMKRPDEGDKARCAYAWSREPARKTARRRARET
jgi:hypothetical protein